MVSLSEYLKAAPKPYVLRIFRRENPRAGLMQTAMVSQAAFDWLVREERLSILLREIPEEALEILLLVYMSEDRGARAEELAAQLPPDGAEAARNHLARLEHEVLVCSREGEYLTYQGFDELAPAVLRALLLRRGEEGPVSDSTLWTGYARFLKSHLAHFLSRVALGQIKATQGGELHRKDHHNLTARWIFSANISPAAAQEETVFLFRFAAETGMVVQENARLHLSARGGELAAGSTAAAEARLLDWWHKDRMRGLARTLRAWEALPAETVFRAAELADFFWIYSGSKKRRYRDAKPGLTWEHLPVALQELWLLGLVEFGLVKGRIQFCRLHPGRLEAASAAGAGEQNLDVPAHPIGLPNFECLVPVSSPFSLQYRVELLSDRENDEMLARHRFSKRSVVQGLQAGLDPETLARLLETLGFDAGARAAMMEWASTYSSTMFLDVLILKVKDRARFDELLAIPEFVAETSETIPGYGFILPRENRDRVRELLGHLGLIPGEDPRRILHLQPVAAPDPATDAWRLVPPEHGEFRFAEGDHGAAARREKARPRQKEKAPEQELDPAEKMSLVESAIHSGSQLELSLAEGAADVLVSPLLLIKHKSPVKIIGIEAETGHRNEYALDEIRSLRAVKR